MYPSAHLSIHPSFHPVCIFCLMLSLLRDTVFYSSLCPHTSQHRACSMNDYKQNLLSVIFCLFTYSLFVFLLFSCPFVSDSSVPWTAACQASLSFTISQSLLKLMSVEFDAIQLSHPLSSPSPSAFNLSQHQGLFQWVSCLDQVAKVLELQHQSFQWIFRVDFLRMGWLDLLAVQETLKSLLQHHSLKVSPPTSPYFFSYLKKIN